MEKNGTNVSSSCLLSPLLAVQVMMSVAEASGMEQASGEQPSSHPLGAGYKSCFWVGILPPNLINYGTL